MNFHFCQDTAILGEKQRDALHLKAILNTVISQEQYLFTIVGGFNPLKKCARQIGNLPQFSGWKNTYLKPPAKCGIGVVNKMQKKDLYLLIETSEKNPNGWLHEGIGYLEDHPMTCKRHI